MRQKTGQAIAPFFIFGQGRHMQPSDVTVISVCYNSAEIIKNMLASIPDGTRVILVDNASDDIAQLRSIAEAARATLLMNAQNSGFGAACNQGAQAAETEFLFFLNPDTVLKRDALKELVAAANRHKECSAFNPLIVDMNGNASIKRRSVLIPRQDWLPRQIGVTNTLAPVLSGAALFLRKSGFDAIGGFDPEIFMYHEDDDLSLRLHEERGPLMIVPAARVEHASGRSTKRSPNIARLKARHMGESRVYSVRKHNVPFGAARALLQGVLQIFSFSIISSRKRAKSIAFFQGVVSEVLKNRPTGNN